MNRRQAGAETGVRDLPYAAEDETLSLSLSLSPSHRIRRYIPYLSYSSVIAIRSMITRIIRQFHRSEKRAVCLLSPVRLPVPPPRHIDQCVERVDSTVARCTV